MQDQMQLIAEAQAAALFWSAELLPVTQAHNSVSWEFTVVVRSSPTKMVGGNATDVSVKD